MSGFVSPLCVYCVMKFFLKKARNYNTVSVKDVGTS